VSDRWSYILQKQKPPEWFMAAFILFVDREWSMANA